MKHLFIIMSCIALVFFLYGKEAKAQYGKATQQGNPTSSTIKSPSITPTSKATSSPTSSFTPSKDSQINVFYDDFSIKKTFGGQIFCQMTFYIDNQTEMQLDALVLDIKWSGISTNLNISNIPPKDLKQERYALVGKGCYTMGETPTLSISKCLMRAITPQKKVIDLPEDTCKNMVKFK